ncbi:hypothetical protein Vretimale_1417 [Volvox reticuliferus]|uniref:Myb-like domain-containing protein n=1 Tax=Volvox reticuliferus TaxID=1737510 RepID=A0A8J4D953_9CHLO|nr:hypothetical protein Vretifemale_10811 [Volvox reticuliferus]GIL95377.1 hypothetical protein Vretimale_1417 [Volvox reticuliferus]
MQSGSAPDSGNSVAALAIDHSKAENYDAALDIAEGSEAVGDIASDRNQQGSQERRPQANRASTSRNKRRGWSAIEISTLALLHAIHGNKWSVIARHYRNRHDGDVKNIFHSALRSKATETNCLLRAYAQAVGPNCDDPRVRQSAYEAARQQYGSAPILSSAAAYLNQQAVALGDDKDPEAGNLAPAEASAEEGPSQPQLQPQPRRQQSYIRTPGPSNRLGKTMAKEAAEEDQGQGSAGLQSAAEVTAPAAEQPRRSRRLARSVQPSDASASAPQATEPPVDPPASGPTDWESDGGGAGAATPYSPSHDVLLQLRSRRDANASLESKAPGAILTDEGPNLEVKQAWGPDGTDGHADGSLLMQQGNPGVVWGKSALDVAHTHLKKRQQQQQQQQRSPSLLHRAAVLRFPGAQFVPPPPQPKAHSPQSRQQHVSYMGHGLAGDASGHGPLYGGHGMPSSVVSTYGNMILAPGALSLTASYPGAASRPSTHMLAPQPLLAPPLSTMPAPPPPLGVGPSTDPNSTNTLGLSTIGHTVAAPYPSQNVYSGTDGAGFRGLPAPAAGALGNTQRLTAAASIHDPDIVSLAGASSGGAAAAAGSGGSQQLDPLEALLRDLESPFTSAASLLGRTRPVESSNPLRLLRPRLPVDPLSMPAQPGLPVQSGSTSLPGSLAPPGAPGPHGQLGAGPHGLLGAGRMPAPPPGQTLQLAPSGTSQLAQWTSGGHAAASPGQLRSAYPALGPTRGGGGAFHSTVSRGNVLMGQQPQGLYNTWVSPEGLAPVSSTGTAAANRISPPPGGLQPFAPPSGGGGGASAMPPLGASFANWASGAFVFTGTPAPVDPAVDYLRMSGANAAAYPPAWPGTGSGGGAADSFRSNAGLYVTAQTATEGPHPVEEPQRQFWQQQVPLQPGGSLSGPYTSGAPVMHQGTAFHRELGRPQPPGDGQSNQGPFGLQ